MFPEAYQYPPCSRDIRQWPFKDKEYASYDFYYFICMFAYRGRAGNDSGSPVQSLSIYPALFNYLFTYIFIYIPS